MVVPTYNYSRGSKKNNEHSFARAVSRRSRPHLYPAVRVCPDLDLEQQEAPIAEQQKEDVDDLIAAARREEKDKLYSELKRLKDQVGTLTAAQKAEQDRLDAEREAAELEARKAAEEEMSVRELLSAKEREWEGRLEEERRERELAIAQLEAERQFAMVTQYRAQRLEEERDTIIPELLDMVSGNTPEEIDQSIAGLQDRSSRILSSAQQAAQTARRDLSGARVTAPPAGPLDDYSEQQTVTAEDISQMSMGEYAKYRARLLGKAGSGQSTGLFG